MTKTALVRFLSFQRTVALNIVAPIGVYQAATSSGVSEMQGLLLAALFPLANIAWSFARQRRLDPIGGLSLVAIVGGACASLLLNDPRILLIKDSLATALLGIACLASLLNSRPMMTLFAIHLGADRERLAHPNAQAAIRRMTLIWGLAFVTEASARVALSFTLDPAILMIVSPLLAAAVFGPLALWTLAASRRRSAISQPAAA